MNSTHVGAVADQMARPSLTVAQVAPLVRRVYGLNVTHVRQMNGYDDLNFHVMVETGGWDNTYINRVSKTGYTLKVTNSVDSLKPRLIDAYNQMMHTLRHAAFPVPHPVSDINGCERTLVQLPSHSDSTVMACHMVRLLVYLPGELLSSAHVNNQLLIQIGELVGRLANTLQTFQHAGYCQHESAWFLHNAAAAAQHSWLVEDSEDRQMLCGQLEHFSQHVLPTLAQLPQGMVHGDINEQNILVTATRSSCAAQAPHSDSQCPLTNKCEQMHVCGLLDVSDSHRSAVIVDLAVAIAYLMMLNDRHTQDDGDSEHCSRLDTAGVLLAGYSRQRALSDDELRVLPSCVAARLCQSLLGGLAAYRQNPDNQYVLSSAAQGWPTLRLLHSMSHEKVADRWRQVMRSFQQQSPTSHPEIITDKSTQGQR